MRFVLLFCLCCWISPSFSADRLQVEGYLLPNGLQVLLKAGSQPGHVTIRLVVGVGFDDFTCADQELPHLLEHLLFSGIDAQGEGGLERRMQSLGGEWNAFTSDSDTTFVIEVPARNQRKALDLLLAALTQTQITEENLATAKKIVEREDGGHYSHLQRWLDRQDIGHDASQQLAVEMGLKCAARATAADLTLKQVNEVRAQWYAPNNMTLIMVGKLDKFLPAHLERTFGALDPVEPTERTAPSLEPKTAQRERELMNGWVGDAAKLHLYFMEPEVETIAPQAWDLLQAYMDWALYSELRLEQGLSYGPWSQQEAFGNSSALSLNADVDRSDVPAARSAIDKLVQRIRQEGLDKETFERLKQAAIDRQAWAVQGDSALADYYWGALSDYEDGRFADPVHALRNISLADINEAARRLFAKPPYVRVEQPMLGYDELEEWITVASVTFGVAVLGIAGAVVWRRSRR